MINESARRKILQAEHMAEEARNNPVTDPTTITLSEEEVNAFISHNIEVFYPELQRRFAPFIDDFGVFFSEGQIILAGRLPELGYVVSFYVQPEIDTKGQLHLTLAKILGGRLPLPQAVLAPHLRKLDNYLTRNMPAWRRRAGSYPSGSIDGDGAATAMGQLLLNSLRNEGADPILCIPIWDNKHTFMPVRLTQIKVAEETLTVTVAPLTPQERQAFFAKVKG